MNDDSNGVWQVLGIIAFIIACCLFFAWLYSSRFDECMAEKNDRITCTIYAESILR